MILKNIEGYLSIYYVLDLDKRLEILPSAILGNRRFNYSGRGCRIQRSRVLLKIPEITEQPSELS